LDPHPFNMGLNCEAVQKLLIRSGCAHPSKGLREFSQYQAMFLSHFKMQHRIGTYVAIIISCVTPALFIEWVSTPPSSKREIHIEAFRYGTSPSIIRANRGDKLVLSFSTRDTGHSFFLQDYHIDAKISPARETVEVHDPFRPTLPPSYDRQVRLTAGLPGVWGNLISVSRFRCHVYCGPMHGFEQGDLIVRPNWLFAGSLGLLAATILIWYLSIRWDAPWSRPHLSSPVDLNRRSVYLGKLLKWRPLQFTSTLPFLAGLVIAILAGLFGTKVGGRNIAVMLTWIVWMSLLTILLIPLGGRIWCMVCPLPVIGEYLQRGATTQVRVKTGGRFRNRFFGIGRPWPRSLRGPWLRLILFLAVGTLSASLAGQPRWTALIMMGLVMAALLMSLIWELRSFCRFVCPVAAFISCYSAVGRLMVRSRDQKVCKACREMPCLRGNAQGWACPYGLAVPGITRNVECGICSECFKSCIYDNVSLAWRRGTWTDRFPTYAETWQAIVLLVLAMVYSLTIHSPWNVMRDMVNLVDKATWTEFGLYTAALWTVSLGVFPLIFWSATGLGIWGNKRSESKATGRGDRSPGLVKQLFNHSTGDCFKKTAPALIPLGLALWAAFFVDTIMVNATFILLSISDPFGWGWDLLGTAGKPWVQIWPSGIPWLQAGLTLAGLTLSLRQGYWRWQDVSPSKAAALQGFVPTALILVTLGVGMLLYFTYF
jgi:polyferredoxin